MLDRPSDFKMHFNSNQWSLPEGLLGLWAIQSTNFQRDNDIHTKTGFFSFLGWFIHHFEHQLVHHHYIATTFSQKNSCLRDLVAANLISNMDIYIPIFFYLVYCCRTDLQDRFNLSTKIGRFRFFQWVTTKGCQEYKNHQIYANHILQLATADISDAGITSLLETIPFDELWYLKHYDDVRLAVDAGMVSSGLEHWNNFGKLEKRLPNAFAIDESWYSDAYPDIKSQIRNKQLVSATQHWETIGYHEGRLPYAPEIVKFKLST